MASHSYQLSARLEAGEISDLYRGRQDLNREVTLKLFSPRSSDPEYGRALAQASREVAALEHPAILHYEDVGVVQERLCAVRAHLDGYHLGTALGRLATKEVVLPPPVALQIMIEVMGAVGAAHQAGLVHGALTPANIHVTRDGRVFVIDFRALWAMQQSAVMKPLAARGRQAYRAPEVAKGHEPDAQSDVYSAGAILYELLTLREVAKGRGAGVSTRRDGLTPPSRLDRRINARIDPLVMRALEPLKSRRYRNCAEMGESLRNLLASQGGVPGRMEIGKFVSEMFPNEVSVSGVGGELPFAGEFALEPVEKGRSIPGLAIDVSERVSYSEPAPLEEGEGVPEGREAEDTTLDQPPRAPSVVVESWDAPPGKLDPAVERKLGEGRPTGTVTEASSEPESTLPLPSLRPPVRSGSGRSAPAPTSEEHTLPSSPPPAPHAERHRGRSGPAARPPAREAGDTRAQTRPEGVASPGSARPRNVAMWGLAGLLALSAAGLTYLGLERRAARGARPAHAHHEPRPEPHEVAAPVERPVAQPARAEAPPAPEPQVHAERPVEAAVAPKHGKPAGFHHCLDVSADLKAEVSVDGVSFGALPQHEIPIAAGPHEVVAAPTGKRHRAQSQQVVVAAQAEGCSPVQFTFRRKKSSDK